MRRPSYYEELVRIRRALERVVYDFPSFDCQLASRIIKLVVGLDEVGGRHVLCDIFHAWNYDPKLELYVDLTMDQFGYREKISVMPTGAGLLLKRDDETERARKYPNELLMKNYNGLLLVPYSSMEELVKGIMG